MVADPARVAMRPTDGQVVRGLWACWRIGTSRLRLQQRPFAKQFCKLQGASRLEGLSQLKDAPRKSLAGTMLCGCRGARLGPDGLARSCAGGCSVRHGETS
jgi:hypothetical protein